MADETPTCISVALDWTPNTNHVGFYVAKALGYYEEVGLKVDIVSPHLDEYATTPAFKLSSKSATFGLGPSETVIGHHLPPSSPTRVKLVAIATVLQEDISAIATLKGSGIARPRDLDGRTYASYAARFEGRIVQHLIQADGGKGLFTEITPNKLGIWNVLVTGKVDATWIFTAWEGVEAKHKKIELNEFRLADYGIPYGYSPVVFVHPDTIIAYPDMVKHFLRATAKGYTYSVANTDKASLILCETANEENPTFTEPLDPPMVLASMDYLSKYLLNKEGNWGLMDPNRWKFFLNWLSNEHILTTLIQSRNPVADVSVSLDDLRDGNSGDSIQDSEIRVENLFTNDHLTCG
uniref:Thiamine pyrimidine synthase n=1 Tax=Araucaria cunninghamii TaxID=56994 RepID=A0A0D6R7S3_ARACU